MPELPEVETTLHGIRPHLEGRRVLKLVVRESRLRVPIPPDMVERVDGQQIQTLYRRGKYILMGLEQGTIIVHLGMSGSLRLVSAQSPPRRHDHLDLVLEGGSCLRFHDPRRFGVFLWTPTPPDLTEREHPLLRDLGPEPLHQGFDGDYLYAASRGKRLAVKPFIMNATVVVGVGNIYANESLFLAGIHPSRSAGRIGLARYRQLAGAIRSVLTASITQGGTTLRDFVQENGRPGYFAQSLQVYGREDQPCRICGEAIRQRRIGQRSSFYCPHCQR